MFARCLDLTASFRACGRKRSTDLSLIVRPDRNGAALVFAIGRDRGCVGDGSGDGVRTCLQVSALPATADTDDACTIAAGVNSS